ncbi:MAG: class I SAM-dependent methyltransferase [Candidatus Paceibacterota bacterium]|jgi:2-polyprenyl-3-methyl-5-hydroxy-6-metoxy-1,4-benzoquinol methylase
MDLKETYNKIALDWSKDHMNDDWWVKGTDKFISFLNPGSKILDVGCGPGNKADYFIKRGFSVVGIDFSENMIAIAKRDVPGGTFKVLDMRYADKLEGEFDAVFMQASLLHIPKKEAEGVVRGFVGKLSNGGFLYVAVKETKPGTEEEGIKTDDDYGYEYRRFFSYFTLDEIKLIFRNLGLSAVYEGVTPLGNTRWLEIVGKK